MIIFLGRIPANTKKREISNFVKPALKNGFFKKPGTIDAVDILVLKDIQINTLEFHGLVKVAPASIAQKVIKKLNRKEFKGKKIAVREYYKRTWHNDPRVDREGQNKNLIEKRKSDRRRSKLEVMDDISDKFSSSEGFHRRL